MKLNHKLKVNFSGGLGNQIFQLYAGLYFGQISECDLILDTTRVATSHSRFDISSFKLPFEMKKNLSLSKISKRTPKVASINDWLRNKSPFHLVDQGFEQNLAIVEARRIMGISGYFQDLRYFQLSHYPNLELAMKSSKSEKIGEKIRGRNTLSVHVRRGDFIGQTDSHGCLSRDWYHKTITRTLMENLSLDLIIFFTDDANWVQENIINFLESQIESILISSVQIDDPAESWFLMTQSTHIICANSTFSITAAISSSAEITIPFPLTRNQNFKELTSSIPTSWNFSASHWE